MRNVHGADSDQKLHDCDDEMETLKGINRGVADVEAGRVSSVEHFEKEFRKKHSIPRQSPSLGKAKPMLFP
jgi:hypothetical protein